MRRRPALRNAHSVARAPVETCRSELLVGADGNRQYAAQPNQAAARLHRMRAFHAALLVAILGAGACTGGRVVAERAPTTENRTALPPDEVAIASAEPHGSIPKSETPSATRPSDAEQGSVQTVRVFFSPASSLSCAEVTPVMREVQTTRAVATAALNQLFKGATAEEEARGLRSFFGPDTAGMLPSVRVENGVAYVDLDDITDINNVSTSCGSTSFLAQMDATLKQFPTVTQAVYAMEGDPESFYTFLQRVCPDLLLDKGPQLRVGSVLESAKAHGTVTYVPISTACEAVGYRQ